MARIRTIKPEFWQNEQLASLGQHARLLAIALLNHADDKGYFLASHQLVRAACFPFEEDSKNVLGSLQELSRIGYIETKDCDGKQVGRICKFLDHQRIDKPQKSKLHDVFEANHEKNSDSKSVPGTFQESSGNDQRLERKGKEGNRKGMEEVSAIDCFESWYLNYPKKVGKDAAAKAYAKAIKSISPEGLLQASLPRLARLATREPRFIPNPATWLNGGGWKDDVDAIAPTPKSAFGPGQSYDPNHNYDAEIF